MDCRVRTEREARRQWRGSRRRLDDGVCECNPKGKITPTPRGARGRDASDSHLLEEDLVVGLLLGLALGPLLLTLTGDRGRRSAIGSALHGFSLSPRYWSEQKAGWGARRWKRAAGVRTFFLALPPAAALAALAALDSGALGGCGLDGEGERRSVTGIEVRKTLVAHFPPSRARRCAMLRVSRTPYALIRPRTVRGQS